MLFALLAVLAGLLLIRATRPKQRKLVVHVPGSTARIFKEEKVSPFHMSRRPVWWYAQLAERRARREARYGV